MRINLKVNTSGLETKLRKNVNAIIKQMIIDAAEYLARKIRDEVISGQVVGVITGNLRRGTAVEEIDGKVHIVSEMDYTKFVMEWSRNKFGISYFDYANQMYGGNLSKIIQDEAKKIYSKNYTYQNPFP